MGMITLEPARSGFAIIRCNGLKAALQKHASSTKCRSSTVHAGALPVARSVNCLCAAVHRRWSRREQRARLLSGTSDIHITSTKRADEDSPSFGGHRRRIEASTAALLDRQAYPSGALDDVVVNDLCAAIEYWARHSTKGGDEDGAEVADRLFRRLIEERLSGNNAATPTADQLNMVLDSWRLSGRGKLSIKGENLLRHVETLNKEHGLILPLDVKSYLLVIDALRRAGMLSAAKRAVSLLHSMQDNKLIDSEPHTICFNAALNAFSKCGHEKGAAEQAEGLLWKMEELCVEPDARSFNAVIDAWSKTDTPGAPQRAERILRRMQRLYKNGNEGVKPTAVSFTCVIDAWSRSGEDGAAERAEDLLREMLSLDVQPSTTTIGAIINAYARTRSTVAAQRAEQILQRIQIVYEDTGNAICKPNTFCFNGVIDAWANSGDSRAAEKAESIVLWMQQLYEEEGNSDVQPNTVSFTSVINAWSQSGEGERAEAILHRMQDLHKAGYDAKPNTVSFTAAIHAWAKSGRRGSAEKAERLLKRMQYLHDNGDVTIEPNTRSYNAVLNAFARSRDRGSEWRAEALLQSMIDLHRAGNTKVKPDRVSFGSVIHSWCHSKERWAAQHAEALLQKMANLGIRPDTVCFSSVCQCWSRSRERGSAERAEKVLNQMINDYSAGNMSCKPNAIAFTNVMNAWANSNEGDAGERAEMLLKKMYALVEEGNSDVKPDKLTYLAVINCWSRRKDKESAHRVDRLLHRMEQLAQDGDDGVAPDTTIYNAALNAFARSTDPDKATKAASILSSMERRYILGYQSVRPDVKTYNNVIFCCAFSMKRHKEALRLAVETMERIREIGHVHANPWTAKRSALRIALETFARMRSIQDVLPNDYTYDGMLKAIGNLSRKETERAKLLEAIFRRCCDDGMLSDNVLRSLKRAAPRGMIQRLFSPEANGLQKRTRAGDLPPSWSRNVDR